MNPVDYRLGARRNLRDYSIKQRQTGKNAADRMDENDLLENAETLELYISMQLLRNRRIERLNPNIIFNALHRLKKRRVRYLMLVNIGMNIFLITNYQVKDFLAIRLDIEAINVPRLIVPTRIIRKRKSRHCDIFSFCAI